MISTLYLISEWIIRLIMIPVVTRRRLPSSALAWLAVVFAVPWLGLVLYGLFGSHRLGRLRARRRQRGQQQVHDIDRLAVLTRHVERPELTDAQQPLINLAMNMGGLPLLGGNQTEMLAETENFIDRLVNDINAAEDHVHLLFYIFRDDTTGKRVADALCRASARGVRCRLLVDGVGSWRVIGGIPGRLRDAGVDFEVALPVNPIRRAFARIDLRNHRKIAVLDGRIGYAGSQNIVDPDYGTKKLAWHDLMLRLTGPAVLHLQRAFLEDWHAERGELPDGPELFPEPDASGEVTIQVVPSGPTYPVESFHHLVVEALNSVRRRLIITTPYFVPDEASLLALKLAVMRGARVDLVVPRQIDHPLVALAMASYYDQLLEAGVNIHVFRHGLLHSKSITVDDAFALIGSANFDMRSFYLNFEINLMLFGPRPCGELRFIQQHYIDQCYPLDLNAWRDRPAVKAMLENTARLLSPLL